MRVTDKFVFFFTAEDVFSNWYIAPFYDNNVYAYNPEVEAPMKFSCVEQYMMWRKASLFEDYGTAVAILSGSRKRKGEKDQAYYKRMGREVQGYDEGIWQANRELIVKRGIILKYTYNPHLKEELLKHKGKTFVEASPYDGIYGIKMGMWDAGVEDPSNWKGENLLGKWHTDFLEWICLHSDIT